MGKWITMHDLQVSTSSGYDLGHPGWDTHTPIYNRESFRPVIYYI